MSTSVELSIEADLSVFAGTWPMHRTCVSHNLYMNVSRQGPEQDPGEAANLPICVRTDCASQQKVGITVRCCPSHVSSR